MFTTLGGRTFQRTGLQKECMNAANVPCNDSWKGDLNSPRHEICQLWGTSQQPRPTSGGQTEVSCRLNAHRGCFRCSWCNCHYCVGLHGHSRCCCRPTCYSALVSGTQIRGLPRLMDNKIKAPPKSASTLMTNIHHPVEFKQLNHEIKLTSIQKYDQPVAWYKLLKIAGEAPEWRNNLSILWIVRRSWVWIVMVS